MVSAVRASLKGRKFVYSGDLQVWKVMPVPNIHRVFMLETTKKGVENIVKLWQ